MITPDRPGRRHTRRCHVMWPATLVHEDKEHSCTILDISNHGAKIDVKDVSFRPSLVRLRCEHFGVVEGWLLWSRGAKAGIRFEEPGSEMLERLKSVVPGLARKEAPGPSAPRSKASRPLFGRLPPAKGVAADPASDK